MKSEKSFACRAHSWLAICVVMLACLVTMRAQTTTFTYQGRLSDGGTNANGVYDLQFALFDSAGVQVGVTQTLEDVQVTNGVFTVQLDFGAAAFATGATRMLEIAVRPGAASKS